MIDHPLAGPVFGTVFFGAVAVWFRLRRGRVTDAAVRSLYRLNRATWCLARSADQAVITWRTERAVTQVAAACEEVHP